MRLSKRRNRPKSTGTVGKAVVMACWSGRQVKARSSRTSEDTLQAAFGKTWSRFGVYTDDLQLLWLYPIMSMRL